MEAEGGGLNGKKCVSAASPQILLDLPYPPIKIHCCSRANGLAMLDNMGGMNSEMTAVSQYLYNSLVLEACDPELSNIFSVINRVEMHHLQIFGQLAAQLGWIPDFGPAGDVSRYIGLRPIIAIPMIAALFFAAPFKEKKKP